MDKLIKNRKVIIYFFIIISILIFLILYSNKYYKSISNNRQKKSAVIYNTVESGSIVKKVLIVNIDPLLKTDTPLKIGYNGTSTVKCKDKTLSECFYENGYISDTPKQAVDDLVNDIETSSHNIVDIQLVDINGDPVVDDNYTTLKEFPEYSTTVKRYVNGNWVNNGDYSLDETSFFQYFNENYKGWYFDLFNNDASGKKILDNQKLDYIKFVTNTEYWNNGKSIVDGINSGLYDEVWVPNLLVSRLWESAMVGENPYTLNAISYKISGSKNFAVMNVSTERRDTNYECFGHAAESVLGNQVFKSGNQTYNKNVIKINSGSKNAFESETRTFNKTIANINDLDLWTYFTLNGAASNYASVGNVHYSPNSTKDYDWNNETYIYSSWADWFKYPYLTGETTYHNQQATVNTLKNRSIPSNYSDFDVYGTDYILDTNDYYSNARQHHLWWFYMMPHVDGRTKDGYSNNWWTYLAKGDYVTGINKNDTTNIKKYYLGDNITDLSFNIKNYMSNTTYTHTIDFIPETELNVISSNENIVKIVDNKLKAVGIGRTNITYYLDGKSATYNVTVEKKPEITIGETTVKSYLENSEEKIYIGYGGTITTDITTTDIKDNEILDVVIKNENNENVTSVLSIDEVKVKNNNSAIAIRINESSNVLAGVYTVYVSYNDSHTKSYEITIYEPTKITSIEADDITLKKAEEKQIDVKINPTGATDKRLNYKSNDETIVTVDKSGKLKGISRGTTTIEIGTEDKSNVTKMINVTVIDSTITIGETTIKSYLENSEEKIYIGYGGSITTNVITTDIKDNEILDVVIKNENDINVTNNFIVNEVKVKENNSAIVLKIEESSNVLAGVYTVYVSYNDSYTKSYEITIYEPTKITSIEVDDITLKKAEEKQIDVKINPTGATDKRLNYKSNDETIVTVDKSGKLKGISRGTTTIEISTEDKSNVTKMINVTVIDSTITVGETAIKSYLNNNEEKIYIGYGGSITTNVITTDIKDNEILDVVIKNENNINVTNNFIIDESKVKENNSAIIIRIVESSNVLAGVYKVYVSYNDSYTTSYEITIYEPTKITSIEADDITLNIEQNKQIVTTIAPLDATDKRLNYKSNDETIATVDKRGNVTGIKSGKTTIEISTDDKSNVIKTINVTVTGYRIKLNSNSKYKIVEDEDKYYIENIKLKKSSKLTKKEFVSNFEIFNAKIYTRDGKTLVTDDDTKIKTGMIIKTNDLEYRIIIHGEITGDGTINISDVAKLFNNVMTKNIKEDYYLKAGDITGDNKINISDVAKLFNFNLGNVDSL